MIVVFIWSPEKSVDTKNLNKYWEQKILVVRNNICSLCLLDRASSW